MTSPMELFVTFWSSWGSMLNAETILSSVALISVGLPRTNLFCCPNDNPPYLKQQITQQTSLKHFHLLLVTLGQARLTYSFNFWHSSTLALSPECQSAQMSEIKNVGQTWMAKCNQLTSLPFKGLKYCKNYSNLLRPGRDIITSDLPRYTQYT